MIGISFIAHCTTTKLLETALKVGILKNSNWIVDLYISARDDEGIQEGLYTSFEIAHQIDRLSENEIAEFFCMFGFSQDNMVPTVSPATIAEYMSSKFHSALLCTDICEFDFYCKDQKTLLDFCEMLDKKDICCKDKIRFFTLESNVRTSFNVL